MLLAVSAVFLAGGFGCGTGTTSIAGGIPAAPPAPPAELPSALKIPEDLGINVDKVSATPSSQAAFVASGGAFSNVVAKVPALVTDINDSLKKLLDPYHQLTIPVGTNIHNFQGLSVVTEGVTTIFIKLKIDFSPFDTSEFGVQENCKGNTAELPLCVRIWADGQRALAGFCTAFPSDQNPGACQFMGRNITETELFRKDQMVRITYDHHDAAIGKSTELLALLPVGGGFSNTMNLTQDGVDATALKTIVITTEDTINNLFTEGTTRWKEDVDLWSGSLHHTPPDAELPTLTNQCVDLLTGDGADRDKCLNAGIDVGNIPFAPLPGDTDVFFPKDFPTTPTF